jgi:hypothetical protein
MLTRSLRPLCEAPFSASHALVASPAPDNVTNATPLNICVTGSLSILQSVADNRNPLSARQQILKRPLYSDF